jgi:PKD repeat protein
MGDGVSALDRSIAIAGWAIVALATVLLLALLAFQATAAANLYVGADDIAPAVERPTQGTVTTVNVTVHNGGDANATGFQVLLRDTTASKDLGTLGPFNCTMGGSLKASFSWDLAGAAAGNHTLRATADADGDVAESDETDNSATRVVSVNQPPVAVANASRTTALSLINIDFDGTGSSDPDGTITSYLWYYGDGAIESDDTVSHSYGDGSPTPGRAYNITLVVTDSDGGVSSSTLTVRILNRAPVALAVGGSVNTKTPFTLSGALCLDADGHIATWSWALQNGTVLTGSSVSVSYDDDGKYAVTLTITDDDGATDSVSIDIVVLNQAPTVDVRANRTLVGKGEPIRFDGSGSRDVDGSIVNFTWIYGDSQTATGSIVEHSFATNGSYNVTLVAADDDGAVTYKGVGVIVGNSPPVAIIVMDLGNVLTFENVTFLATGSYDINRNIATYSWDFGDGASQEGFCATHNWTDDGTYTVTLVVTDTAGATGSTTASVIVDNRPPHAEAVDLSVMTNESAAFTGSLCFDADGYIAEWRWDCGGGTVLTTSDASNSWSSPGTYVVILTVKDDDGASASTTFEVTVKNRSPRAHIVATPLEVTRTSPVTFNGSGSMDTDGTIANWTWSFGDGSTGHGSEVVHTYASYGSYLVILIVRDDRGAVNSTGITITVRNQPPTAAIVVTPDSALTGIAFTFNGTSSTDPENQISEYYWAFGDGQSATGPVVTHAYTDDGWYSARLTVVDQDGATSFTDAIITVHNRPPDARASSSTRDALTLEDVSFSAEGSSDPDGRVLWCMWEFGDGWVEYGLTPTHAFANDGTFTAVLTVTDDDGDEAVANVSVTIRNRAPRAAIAGDAASVVGGLLRLDGRGSSDPDGKVVEWRWDFGDGSATGSGQTVNHAYARRGTFNVTLTVVDDDGATAAASWTVTVTNVAPVARITGAALVHSGEQVSLSGTTSYDLDGTITEYRWDFGDGATGVGPTMHHQYAKIGAYVVSLTVEDDGGLTSTVEVTVQVLNQAPHAKVTVSPAMVLTSDVVTLDARGSSDPDGALADYTWIFGDGSVAHGAQVSHSYASDGIYMVVLTVVDDAGGADSTSIFVQVENRAPIAAAAGPGTALTLDEVTFRADGTVDPDGVIADYFWDFGDGRSAKGREVIHSYDASGTYTVRLTVMDDDSRTDATSISLIVSNRPPVVATNVTAETYVNGTVRFDGTASYDPDGLVSRWAWSFGDGTTGEGREVFHVYLVKGSHEWNLTIYDDKGSVSLASGTVLIKDRPVITPPATPGGHKATPGMGAVAAALAVVSAAVAAAVGASARRRRE